MTPSTIRDGLVERLRFTANNGIPDFTNSKILDEAADEIERLRSSTDSDVNVAARGFVRRFEYESMALHRIQREWLERELAALLSGGQSSPDNSVLQNDLRETLIALGLPDCARPQSPHEVFQECIAEVRRRQSSPDSNTERMRDILNACDHTLTVHGHIDRDTPLHERIVRALALSGGERP